MNYTFFSGKRAPLLFEKMYEAKSFKTGKQFQILLNSDNVFSGDDRVNIVYN